MEAAQPDAVVADEQPVVDRPSEELAAALRDLELARAQLAAQDPAQLTKLTNKLAATQADLQQAQLLNEAFNGSDHAAAHLQRQLKHYQTENMKLEIDCNNNSKEAKLATKLAVEAEQLMKAKLAEQKKTLTDQFQRDVDLLKSMIKGSNKSGLSSSPPPRRMGSPPPTSHGMKSPLQSSQSPVATTASSPAPLPLSVPVPPIALPVPPIAVPLPTPPVPVVVPKLSPEEQQRLLDESRA